MYLSILMFSITVNVLDMSFWFIRYMPLLLTTHSQILCFFSQLHCLCSLYFAKGAIINSIDCCKIRYCCKFPLMAYSVSKTL
jgi:hypothetical protein